MSKCTHLISLERILSLTYTCKNISKFSFSNLIVTVTYHDTSLNMSLLRDPISTLELQLNKLLFLYFHINQSTFRERIDQKKLVVFLRLNIEPTMTSHPLIFSSTSTPNILQIYLANKHSRKIRFTVSGNLHREKRLRSPSSLLIGILHNNNIHVKHLFLGSTGLDQRPIKILCQ